MDGSGTLAPGDSVTVTFNAIVDGTTLGGAMHRLKIKPKEVVSIRVELRSSILPIAELIQTATTSGEPGDTGGEDDPTPISIADVAVAKNVVGTPVALPNGNFSVTYQMVIENTGSVDLMPIIQLTEDLETEFGAGVSLLESSLLPRSRLDLRDGRLDSTDSLSSLEWWTRRFISHNDLRLVAIGHCWYAGDAITVDLHRSKIDPDATGTAASLDNTAQVSATDPSGTPSDGRFR